MQGCVHEQGLAATAPVCVTDQSLHDSQILALFKNMLEDQKETVRTQSRPCALESKKNHEAIMSGGAAVKGFPAQDKLLEWVSEVQWLASRFRMI